MAISFVFDYLIFLEEEFSPMPNTRLTNKKAIFLVIGTILLRNCLSKSPGIYLIIPNTGVLHKF